MPEWMPDWLAHTTIFGEPLADLGTALVVAVVAFVGMMLGLRIAQARLERVAGRTPTNADNAVAEVLAGTRGGLIALIALLIGAGMLELPQRWEARVHQFWVAVLTLQIALWANRLVAILLRRHRARHGPTATGQGSAAATLTAWGARTLLWTVAVLAVLANFGVNINAFVASLGVGGIAVALAAQTILGDLFASLSIAIDKPFEVDDFIILANGKVLGSVEHIGLKTTRLRSLGGEQIVISNTELLKQTIANYKRMLTRRIQFNFSVTYDTPRDLAAQIPQLVREIILESERLKFDRAHLKALGQSSLDYEVVYFVQDPDYNLYMDEQQRINLALLKAFTTRGIRFAFPTRTLFVVPPDGADSQEAALSAPPPRRAAARSPADRPA